MSWESVEQLPGERRGGAGAFRGKAEPVVAERGGPSPRERFLLFWLSTPELKFRRSAKRLMLTPSHLYVERLDGERSRVRRNALRGRRMDRGRVVYGIVDGEDLALLPRTGCEVVDALEAQLRGESEPLEPVVIRRGFAASLMAATTLLAVAWAVTENYAMSRALAHIQRGQYTSEIALSFWGLVILCALAVAALAAGPMRIRIDMIGVHVARGILPWLHTLHPPEGLRVIVRKNLRPPGRAMQPGWIVSLVGVGTKSLRLGSFVPAMPGDDLRDAAVDLGERVGKLLDSEVKVLGQP